MKPIIKIVLLAFFWTGIPACILNCPDYWRVSEMNISFWDNMQGQFSGGNTGSDSLVINVNLIPEQYSFYNNDFSNSLLAWSCSDPYLKSGYTSIEVTSSSTFNDVATGNILNGKLSVLGTNYPIDSILSWYLHQGKLFHTSESFSLVLKEKPGVPNHQFTFKLIDESGNEVSATSAEVIWE